MEEVLVGLEGVNGADGARLLIEYDVLDHLAVAEVTAKTAVVLVVRQNLIVVLQDEAVGRAVGIDKTLVGEPDGAKVDRRVGEAEAVQGLAVLQRDDDVVVGDNADLGVIERVGIGNADGPKLSRLHLLAVHVGDLVHRLTRSGDAGDLVVEVRVVEVEQILAGELDRVVVAPARGELDPLGLVEHDVALVVHALILEAGVAKARVLLDALGGERQVRVDGTGGDGRLGLSRNCRHGRHQHHGAAQHAGDQAHRELTEPVARNPLYLYSPLVDRRPGRDVLVVH